MNLADFPLIAAPHSPMHTDGSLNLAVVHDQAQHLVASGVTGAFIVGTTGEGQSLTIAERQILTEQWVATEERTSLDLFVHVGHNCQRDACHLAAHAASMGADAIAVHAPCCYKPNTVKDLIDFCVPIAAAAPVLPFYLYDIPSITGVMLKASEFLEEGKGRMPNLAGIKFTNLDIIELQECIQLANGSFKILWGCDEGLLAGIACGATGAVGSTYNFAAPLYRRILDAIEANDWETARTEQARAVTMVRVLQRFGGIAAIKTVMKFIGIDCGPVRPPLRELSTMQQTELRAELKRIGFFNLVDASEGKVA